MSTNFSPKFLKAKVSFTYSDQVYDMGEQLVNLDGIERMEWNASDPREMIGQTTQVKVVVQATRTFAFDCLASFTCEQSELLVYLGLSFILPIEIEQVFSKILESEGSQPDYVRKFPRINYSEKINLMPEFCILGFNNGVQEIVTSGKIINMSPTGVKFSCEDPRLTSISPGSGVELQLCPRGPFMAAINIVGVVRSLSQISMIGTGNAMWKLGVEISSIPTEDREHFKELLRNIVERIRTL